MIDTNQGFPLSETRRRARMLEFIPHLDLTTRQDMWMENGHAFPSDAPGLGGDWDWTAIADLAEICETVKEAG